MNGVMVARLLGEATAVRGAAIRFLTDFRGLPPAAESGMFDAASYSRHGRGFAGETIDESDAA